MGSLIGHVVPGSFFIIFAIWYSVYGFIQHFSPHFRKPGSGRIRSPAPPPRRSRKRASPNNNNDSEKSLDDLDFPVPVLIPRPSRFPPWDVTIRTLFTLVGIAGEYVTALDENGHFKTLHNAQHMTMFSAFLLVSLAELLIHYKVPGLPAKLDVFAAFTAFAIEGVLFLWHLEGRNRLDVQVHTFLVYTIFAALVTLALEAVSPEADARAYLMRNTALLVQGAWFYVVGFILYPPRGWEAWDPESHAHRMIVTMAFTWTVALVVLFQFVLGFVVFQVMRRQRSSWLRVKRAEVTAGKSEVTMNLLGLTPDDDDEDASEDDGVSVDLEAA